KDPKARLGVAGVLWPSILWPDDAESASMDAVVPGGGGAAGFGGGAPVPAAQATPKQIREGLGKGSADARQLKLLEELTAMLEAQPKTEAALKEFRAKLGEFTQSESRAGLDKKQPDAAEGAIAGLNDQKWRGLLEVLGDQ